MIWQAKVRRIYCSIQDVVQSTVINWESDRYKPKLYATQMKARCDLLGFTLEELSAAEVDE